MKRTIKPFAVEVRSAGRTKAVRNLFQAPEWPTEPEKPAERPQAAMEVLPAAIAPAGRVLPALDDPWAAFEAMKPKRRGQPRRVPIADEAVPDWIGKPAQEVRGLGEVGASADGEASAHAGERPSVDVERINPGAAATERPTRRLPRPPRSAFPLGQRWKARLSAACRD